MRGRVIIRHAGGYDPRKGADHPDNQDPTLEAHVISMDLGNAQDVLDTMLGGPAYRWRCSCRKKGEWTKVVHSALSGGARHVAAMERAK